jgi:hypothetical protein
VSEEALPDAGREVLRADGCIVYERNRVLDSQVGTPVITMRVLSVGRTFRRDGKEGVYQPASFRVGSFLSLCALLLVAAVFGHRIASGHAS